MPPFRIKRLPFLTPPFSGLWIVVIAYFALAHLLYPNNDVMRGNLPDPDDYMYLAQTLNWLNGQSWFDNVQHRMNPPFGVVMHFSRFVQMPLAAGIWGLEKIGMAARDAALAASMVEPFILLGICLHALKRAATHIMLPAWAGASAYVALFSVTLLYVFMPGQIGHHGFVIVLILYGMSLVFGIFEKPAEWRKGIALGLLFAFALMIALESLPWILLMAAYLGVWSLKKGRQASLNGAVFGASFVVGSVLCLMATRPWADIMRPEIMAYSVVYVYLAVAVCAPFLAAFLCERLGSTAIRWIVGIAAAGISGALFLYAFPQMAAGPYGAIDGRLAEILLGNVENAKPILQTENGWAHFFNLMGRGSISLGAALVFLRQAQGVEREKWGLLALMLASAMLLAIFYQYRFMAMEAALVVLPLTALLQRGWHFIGSAAEGRKRFFAEIGLLLAVGPLLAVIVPALFDGRSFSAGVLLFPVESGTTKCDMSRLAKTLNNPYGLGSKPQLILTQMELGPEILFRTGHSVLAGPYHMNVSGNVDTVDFMTADSADDALNIARRRNADLVIACRAVPGLYLRKDNGKKAFIESLFADPAPKGLEPVPSAVIENFVMFRVQPHM